MLRIGTDCSGIEAPIQAIEKICNNYDLEYDHIFSSENNQYAIEELKSMINHQSSITMRAIISDQIFVMPIIIIVYYLLCAS